MSRVVPRRKPLSEEDRKYLLSRGLPTDVYPTSGVESEEASGEGAEGVQASEDDYDDWTAEELKAELNSRDLPTTGKKAELVQRLREDDAANPPE